MVTRSVSEVPSNRASQQYPSLTRRVTSGFETGPSKTPAGDVDGDGDEDVCAVNFFANQGNRIWLSNGKGKFSVGHELPCAGSCDVSLADLDDDGDLDAVVANGFDKPNLVWFNQTPLAGTLKSHRRVLT